MTTLPSLKLTYFDAPGNAEPIRHTLRLCGVPFVDERIAFDAFPQLKPTLPHGKLPILTVDGRVFAESKAILRFVGRLTGMYPPADEPIAALMIDEILDALEEDVWHRLLYPINNETDAEKRKELGRAALDGPLPSILEHVDKRLEAMATLPFFQNPSKVYIHEVMVNDYVIRFRLGKMDEIPTTFINSYKHWIAIHEKVEGRTFPTHPQLQQHPISKMNQLLPPSQLKVTYFDFHARAEHIRLALHMGGVVFHDERISYEEFTSRKAALPYGQVPTLEIDNKMTAAQSFALFRYAGTIARLYPVHDPTRAMQDDEAVERIRELYADLDPTFREQDPVQKQQARQKLVETTWPASLVCLEKRLASWKTETKSISPFVLGEATPTLADIEIFWFVRFVRSGFLDDVPITLLDAYENIVRVHNAVAEHPKVKDWYTKHPLEFGHE